MTANQDKIKVVNKRYFKQEGIYIGRGSPLGNPFSTKKSKFNTIRCKSVEESVSRFKEYIEEQILIKNKSICNALNKIWLSAKKGDDVYLICFCKDENNKGLCHGDIIKQLIEKKI